MEKDFVGGMFFFLSALWQISPALETCGDLKGDLMAQSIPVSIEEAVRLWGHPTPYTPFRNFYSFRSSEGREYWVTTDDSNHDIIVKIVEFLEGSDFTDGRIILGPSDGSLRSCSDVDLSEGKTVADVQNVWGSPEGMIGSGLTYWTYELGEGKKAGFVAFDGRIAHSFCK